MSDSVYLSLLCVMLCLDKSRRDCRFILPVSPDFFVFTLPSFLCYCYFSWIFFSSHYIFHDHFRIHISLMSLWKAPSLSNVWVTLPVSTAVSIRRGPAQDVPFFYTPSHLRSELQSCKSMISTNISGIFIFK